MTNGNPANFNTAMKCVVGVSLAVLFVTEKVVVQASEQVPINLGVLLYSLLDPAHGIAQPMIAPSHFLCEFPDQLQNPRRLIDLK
jgi:hypothetical protein